MIWSSRGYSAGLRGFRIISRRSFAWRAVTNTRKEVKEPPSRYRIGPRAQY
jgi:hypothetical protein